VSEKAKEKEKEKPAAPKFKSIFDVLRASIQGPVVIASRNGVLYEGILTGFAFGFLVLTLATIRGSKYTAKVDVVYVKLDMVQHIHPLPKELSLNA